MVPGEDVSAEESLDRLGTGASCFPAKVTDSFPELRFEGFSLLVRGIVVLLRLRERFVTGGWDAFAVAPTTVVSIVLDFLGVGSSDVISNDDGELGSFESLTESLAKLLRKS
jgi:hypothetical protein